MSETNDEREYSPEELDQMRKESIASYEKEIPLLKLRAEYATLIADIEVQETRRIAAVLQRVNMRGMQTQPPKEETPLDEKPEEQQPKKRQLKTE